MTRKGYLRQPADTMENPTTESLPARTSRSATSRAVSFTIQISVYVCRSSAYVPFLFWDQVELQHGRGYHSLGKSSQMSNDAHGLLRGLLHSMSKEIQAIKLQIQRKCSHEDRCKHRRNASSRNSPRPCRNAHTSGQCWYHQTFGESAKKCRILCTHVGNGDSRRKLPRRRLVNLLEARAFHS